VSNPDVPVTQAVADHSLVEQLERLARFIRVGCCPTRSTQSRRQDFSASDISLNRQSFKQAHRLVSACGCRLPASVRLRSPVRWV
jgi:hypothetical protein